MKKKRYILFGFSEYYPGGGMNDVLCRFNENEYYRVKGKHGGHDSLQILDTHTLKVSEGGAGSFPVLPE